MVLKGMEVVYEGISSLVWFAYRCWRRVLLSRTITKESLAALLLACVCMRCGQAEDRTSGSTEEAGEPWLEALDSCSLQIRPRDLAMSAVMERIRR